MLQIKIYYDSDTIKTSLNLYIYVCVCVLIYVVKWNRSARECCFFHPHFFSRVSQTIWCQEYCVKILQRWNALHFFMKSTRLISNALILRTATMVHQYVSQMANRLLHGRDYPVHLTNRMYKGGASDKNGKTKLVSRCQIVASPKDYVPPRFTHCPRPCVLARLM